MVLRPFIAALSLTIGTQLAQAADLPRVLIIGDSISLGYTPLVRERMKGTAVITHNPGNAKHSSYGVTSLDAWLKSGTWDVIHFNWGLWDLCYRHPESKNQGHRDKVNGSVETPLEDYQKNLETLVLRLKESGAELIWASTTIVPAGEVGRRVGDDVAYNAVAAKVMTKHGVVINDLHRLTKGFPKELFAGSGDVHYKKAGSEKLADQVVQSISTSLKKRAKR
jgi:hypothetical protein